jgi:hypothetical protein
MNNIPLLLSGLFVLGTFLWVQTAVRRSLERDLYEWKKSNGPEQHKWRRPLASDE